MGPYLGDIAEDAIIDFIWDTNDSAGASITRATDGTISVYKANGTTQSVAGITDTEDFDGLTGIHQLRIDTSSDAFYAVGNDYNVVLSAATIDGQTVNAVLCSFSIENRFVEVDITKIAGVTVNTATAQIGANMVQVSGDATAADNLELDYDGTGLTRANSTIGTATVAGSVSGNVDGSVGSLGATAKTDVNAEVSDVLKTDTIAELAQAQPAKNPTFETAIMALYMAFRNQLTSTSTIKSVRNDAGTVIFKSTLSDDGTTFTDAKLATGP